MGDFIVDLGHAEAVLPRKEQSRAETYQTGDRVRVAIVKVLKSAKGPQVVVSRTDPALLMKLFEMEVPEIYDGTVQIRGCVREAGERAKVAVISREKDVDPVGACVGMKGTRVQAVVQELRGEKIDIVHWTADQAEYVCRALAPAKVSKIIIDDEGHNMEVVVPDDQLSLAIGKKGQNVRLASRLAGWRIDVRSESEADEETRRARISLGAVPGINDMVAELLYQSGFKSAEELAEADLETILDVDGIGPEKAEVIYKASREYVAEKRRKEEEQKALAQAAAQAAAEAAAQAATEAATEAPATEGDVTEDKDHQET
jgi:N utilization substance protein A